MLPEVPGFNKPSGIDQKGSSCGTMSLVGIRITDKIPNAHLYSRASEVRVSGWAHVVVEPGCKTILPHRLPALMEVRAAAEVHWQIPVPVPKVLGFPTLRTKWCRKSANCRRALLRNRYSNGDSALECHRCS